MNKLFPALVFAVLAPALGLASNPDPYEPGKIREFTGAPTRVVWVQDTTDVPTVDAERATLRLMGWDSEDGNGERVILSTPAAYNKPLITADGTRVVFGDKLKKTVSVVKWDGSGLKVLIENAAFADVWTDPATGTEWVYAQVQETRDGKDVPVIRRYRMDDPKINELVWDKMPIYMFTVAGDGRAASGGGDGGNSPQGYLTLPNGEFIQRAGGCWPSIAPDNSHRSWVFQGNHRAVHFFVPTSRGGVKAAGYSIRFDESPGLKLAGREEVHRIRWSNNTRFMVCSSPFSEWDYRGEVKVPDAVADRIEIYIGKFSEDLKKLDQWMRVTSNDKGDYWADVWIKPGEGAQAAALDLPAAGTDDAVPEKLDQAALVYTWETGAVGNQIDDPETKTIRQCSGQLKGYARFGLHHAMDLTGGWFVPDDAVAPVLKAVQKNKALALEMIVTPLATTSDERVVFLFGNDLGSAQAALFQRGNQLGLRLNGITLELGPLEIGKPNHVIVSAGKGGLLCAINGKKVMLKGMTSADFAAWKEAPLVFGAEPDGKRNWSGLLEGIRIFARPLDFKQAKQRERVAKENRKDRQLVESVVVEAKLVTRSAAAKPSEIAPYRRCLNVNLYEVQKVVSGTFKDQKIAVAQWSVLDAKVIPEYEAMKEGSVQTLVIEPWEKHPEQDSERKIEGEFFDEVKLYYDATRPKVEAAPAAPLASGDGSETVRWADGKMPGSDFDAQGRDLVLEGASLADSEFHGTVKLAGNGAVAGITVLDGGLDYTRSPEIKLTGKGQGAVAETGMQVHGIQVTHLGSGYTSEPTVVISEPDIAGGRGAKAVAKVDAKSGAIAAINVTDPGSGYIVQPVVSIEGGGGTGAKADALLAVSDIYVLEGGSGYAYPPQVEFSGGGGSGARALAATQSTILRGTADNADVLLVNKGKLEQYGGRVLLDWAAAGRQVGKRRFVNEGEWTLRAGSLKFISSTGMATWYGRENVNSGTMRILDRSWVGCYDFTNTGELELGDGAILGQVEFAQSDCVLRNEGSGVVRVSGGTAEDPAVFGVNSLITNRNREVQNGSEKNGGAAQWIIGDGKKPAAFRITGGQVYMFNHKGARLELNGGGALLLETNDAGGRHRFERREAKLTNHGEMLFAGDLFIRSNHGSFGGINNTGRLMLAGSARLVRLQNSVGPGGLYRAPDYTSLILNRAGGEISGSGSFSYVDKTGEEQAAYMRVINLGNMTPAGKWTLENVNVYLGAVPPPDDGKKKEESPLSGGGTLTVRLGNAASAMELKGKADYGHFVITKGAGNILNVVTEPGARVSGVHRIVTAVAVQGEFEALQFNGAASVPYKVQYRPDGIEVVFP